MESWDGLRMGPVLLEETANEVARARLQLYPIAIFDNNILETPSLVIFRLINAAFESQRHCTAAFQGSVYL